MRQFVYIFSAIRNKNRMQRDTNYKTQIIKIAVSMKSAEDAYF